MMKEGIDYKLSQGFRWLPFGRRYETLKTIVRPNGDAIKKGHRWDGGTGLPMRYDSPSAYAFLCHDRAFQKRDMSLLDANSECTDILFEQVSVVWGLLITLVFWLLLPTLAVFWLIHGRSRGLLKRLIASVVLILNWSLIVATISMKWWLLL